MSKGAAARAAHGISASMPAKPCALSSSSANSRATSACTAGSDNWPAVASGRTNTRCRHAMSCTPPPPPAISHKHSDPMPMGLTVLASHQLWRGATQEACGGEVRRRGAAACACDTSHPRPKSLVCLSGLGVHASSCIMFYALARACSERAHLQVKPQHLPCPRARVGNHGRREPPHRLLEALG